MVPKIWMHLFNRFDGSRDRLANCLSRTLGIELLPNATTEALCRLQLFQNGLAFVAKLLLARWVVESDCFLKLLIDLSQSIVVALESLHVDHFANRSGGGLFGQAGQQRFKLRTAKRDIWLGEQLLDIPVPIRLRCDLNLAVEREHAMFATPLEDVARHRSPQIRA